MADLLPEKWMKGVAITTTCLAVMASIAGSRAGWCTSRNQVLTALVGSKWAYFQAKSIKQNLAETQQSAFEADLSGAVSEQQKQVLEEKLATAKSEIQRYDKEKNEIRQEAETIDKENAIVNKRGGNFSMAVVFFQIGIMLSSVSALLKRKELWVIGLVSGALAIFYLANAIFLFF